MNMAGDPFNQFLRRPCQMDRDRGDRGHRLFFLDSDDFMPEAKAAAARDINGALEGGWSGFAIGERISLSEIVRAHELAEHPQHPARVVVTL
jgi:hypothetical protein